MASRKLLWAFRFTVIGALITFLPASSHANFVPEATGNVAFGAGAGGNADDAYGTVSYAAYDNFDGKNWAVDLRLTGAIHSARPDVDTGALGVVFYQVANDSPYSGGDPLEMINIDILDPSYVTSFGYLWRNEGYSFNMDGTGVGADTPLTSGYDLDGSDAFLLDGSSVRPSDIFVDGSTDYLGVSFPNSEPLAVGDHSTVFFVTTNQAYVQFSDASLDGQSNVAEGQLPVPNISGILVQVPEPTSLLLLLSGIPFVALAARRRK